MTQEAVYRKHMADSEQLYNAASEACRKRDYEAFKANQEQAFRCADEANKVFQHLSPELQKQLRAEAWQSLAEGYVRGLFGGERA